MKTFLKINTIILFLLFILPITWADSNWKAKKTEHFTVFYREGYEQNADELLYNLEHYRNKVIKLTGNKKSEESYITLYDPGIVSNGYYDPLFNRMGIFTYPPQKRFILLDENWYRLVGVHEYTHQMQFTNTDDLPEMATNLLGTPFQPNLWMPGWFCEGITVYSESSLSPYEGRLNDGYFSSYLKTQAKEKRFPNLNTITHLPFEYPDNEGKYLYGGRFFQYLATSYGEDKFPLFFSSIGSSISSYLAPLFPYFGLDEASKLVYGKSLKNLFYEWRVYEEKNANEWKTEGERLTTNGWIKVYPIPYKDKLYYVREYVKKTGAYEYFNFSKIVARDLESGKEEVITSLNSNIHTPLRIEGDKLYYGIFEIERGYKGSPYLDLGIISKVFEKDLNTGAQRVLFKDEVRSLSPISSEELLYAKDKKDTFGSSIFLYLKKEKKKRLLFTTPYLISEILTTPEGIFVVARKNWENWSIYKFTLSDGSFTPIIDTPFNEANIFFSEGMLYFAANYESVYRVYAYSLRDRRLFCLTEEGYADYPIVFPEKNRLYFVGLTSDGFDIFYKKLAPKEIAIPKCKESSVPTFSTIKTKETGYTENLKTLSPKIHIPFPVGAILIGGDCVGENYYILIPYLYGSSNEDVKSGLEGFVLSSFFKPSIFYLGFSSDEEISGGWQYPLFLSLSPGLSNLNLSLEGGLEDKCCKESYIAPGIDVGFSFPKCNVNLLTKYYVDEGVMTSFSLERYISNSSLKIIGDYDYEKEITSHTLDKVDNLLTIEYSFPLLKIRKGFWNPNIYFEDLFCHLFVEGSSKNSRYGFGVELNQEISMLLGNLKFPIHLGWGINKDGERVIYGGLGMSNKASLFPFLQEKVSDRWK